MTGIPIGVALKRISERDGTTERHKFFAPVGATVNLEEPEPAGDEEAMIRAIEQDFKADAELLLDRFQMSHLRPKTKMPMTGNVS